MIVKQESYTVQPHWMISDYHLKGTELDVYCLIWGFTQDEQGCYYGSIKYIADYYEIDTRTVERTLKALEAKGLLRKWQELINGVAVNRYTALRPAVEEVEQAPRQNATPGKLPPPAECRVDPRQIAVQTPGELPGNNKSDKANNNKPRAGAHTQVREEPGSLTVAEVFDEFSRGGPAGLYDTLMDFDQHRQALAKQDKKKLWNPLVAKKICKSIKRLVDQAGVQDRAGYAMAMLNQSIENGWTGVFAVKDFVDKAPAAVHKAAAAPDKPRKITKDTTLADLLGGGGA